MPSTALVIGRIVHFVYSKLGNNMVEYPSIITAVNKDGTINISVFTDISETPENYQNVEEGYEVNNWHWNWKCKEKK